MSGATIEDLEKRGTGQTPQDGPAKNQTQEQPETDGKSASSVHTPPHLVVVSAGAENAGRMGPRLKAAREASNMSIEEASRETRIQKDYIRAIEDMHHHMLPGMPKTDFYLRGYLTTYARALGMSEIPQVVERYLSECGMAIEVAPKESPERQKSTTVKTHEVAADMSAEDDNRLAFGAVIVAVALFAIGAVVLAKPWEAPDVGGQTIDVTAVPGGASSASNAQSPASVGVPVASANLAVRAKRSAWLEVRGADGTVYRSKVMSAGEIYIPRVGASWTVTAQDGSAFEWVLDGKARVQMADAGKPVYAESIDQVAKHLTAQDAAAQENSN